MDYSHMTVTQLREMAKQKGVNKASSLKKQQLIDALNEFDDSVSSSENDKMVSEIDEPIFEIEEKNDNEPEIMDEEDDFVR